MKMIRKVKLGKLSQAITEFWLDFGGAVKT